MQRLPAFMRKAPAIRQRERTVKVRLHDGLRERAILPG